MFLEVRRVPIPFLSDDEKQWIGVSHRHLLVNDRCSRNSTFWSCIRAYVCSVFSVVARNVSVTWKPIHHRRYSVTNTYALPCGRTSINCKSRIRKFWPVICAVPNFKITEKPVIPPIVRRTCVFRFYACAVAIKTLGTFDPLKDTSRGLNCYRPLDGCRVADLITPFRLSIIRYARNSPAVWNCVIKTYIHTLWSRGDSSITCLD